MKKICVVVASRANYGRVKYLMKAIQSHSHLKLQIILGASALLPKFGDLRNILKKDGFDSYKEIFYIVSGETLLTQAKSTGLGIIELATAFEEYKPDAVVTVADRFETMATAIASTYLNIKLIHLQGGEVSGNIDDRVRHSITKLADLHFVCSEESKKRVISMGEKSNLVFNYGCPSMDTLVHENLSISEGFHREFVGVGNKTDFSKPYILMLQHPVTTAYNQGFDQTMQTLLALKNINGYQKIVLWPNVDAGSNEVSKAIRTFREKENNLPDFYFIKNLSPENYAILLNNAICCVGNSSSFIRECSFLGIPSIIVGDRQSRREHGKNVVFCEYIKNQIQEKIYYQISKKKYKRETIFGEGDAGFKIAKEIYTYLNSTN